MTATRRGNQAGVEIRIARMTEHDLLEVIEIEEESGISKWGWDAYHDEIQQGEDAVTIVARVRSSTAGIDEPAIAGFVCARQIGDELHVNNLAVRVQYRERSIGSLLLRRLIDEAKIRAVRVIMLEVRHSNEVAQHLYRKFGFRVVGIRKGYYPEPPEDAVLMDLEFF